jgi:hypothetical protein
MRSPWGAESEPFANYSSLDNKRKVKPPPADDGIPGPRADRSSASPAAEKVFLPSLQAERSSLVVEKIENGDSASSRTPLLAMTIRGFSAVC